MKNDVQISAEIRALYKQCGLDPEQSYKIQTQINTGLPGAFRRSLGTYRTYEFKKRENVR